MSKNISNNKLFSRAYKIKNIKNNDNNNNDNNTILINDNINSSVQDIINLYTNSNLNNNNITIDYPRHYSPSYRNNFKLNYNSNINNIYPYLRKNNNLNNRKEYFSQSKKYHLNDELNESEIISSVLINNNNNNNNYLKRDKTQIILVKNEEEKTILPQINNNTNINIHIYRNDTNNNNDSNFTNINNNIFSKINNSNNFNRNYSNNNMINNYRNKNNNIIYKNRNNSYKKIPFSNTNNISLSTRRKNKLNLSNKIILLNNKNSNNNNKIVSNLKTNNNINNDKDNNNNNNNNNNSNNNINNKTIINHNNNNINNNNNNNNNNINNNNNNNNNNINNDNNNNINNDNNNNSNNNINNKTIIINHNNNNISNNYNRNINNNNNYNIFFKTNDNNNNTTLIYSNKKSYGKSTLPSIQREQIHLKNSNSNPDLLFNNKNFPSLKNNINTNISNNNNILNIDTAVNFLRDFSNDTSIFFKFIKLIQCHVDLEILFDSINGGKNTVFRRKTNIILSNEHIFRLSKILNNFFNILGDIYIDNNNNTNTNNNNTNNTNNNNINNNNNKNNTSNYNNNNTINDKFYIFSHFNNLFHKCIKVQICIYQTLLILLSQFNIYEISTMIKNHFLKIVKEISNPLFNFFEMFTKDEIVINYPDLIKKYFNLQKFEKIYNEHKNNKNLKNSDILLVINKNVDKSIISLKYFSTLNLKFSLIKPFGDALNQMIASIDRKSLNNFAQISLLTIVFGELDKNKNYIYYNNDNNNNNNNDNNNNNNNNNNNLLYQQVSDTSPYLPPINPKYKYTLVLDMDETLIHFFFSHISGMFFFRTYTFNFLKSLQPFFEIITFTAGTKEYADNILNIIDNKNNIINYRLYRNHTTIINLNVYKDLSKIGRDLKKTIIIDNLKDNYKLQFNNGIYIKTWTSDINDNWLKEIKRILITIVKKQVNDVRKVIEKINEEVIKKKNINNNYMGINIEKICDFVNNNQKD